MTKSQKSYLGNKTPWQTALSQVITDIEELLYLLNLPAENLAGVYPALSQFALRVPRAFVDRMKPGDPFDPLLRQVLASADELVSSANFKHDPLQESQFSPLPGLLHKYHGRVLLMAAGGCAINCRYCFRRHFPYDEHILGRSHFANILKYIQNDSTIEEVIFSGGDPLLLKDAILKEYIQKIAEINHVTRIRIHTRLPIVIPQRITETFIDAMTATRLKPIIILHSNHANEIDDHVMEAVSTLRKALIPVFNQAVLLKQVNDSIDAQVSLAKKLFAAGIIPYYLHLLDSVSGAEHFLVEYEQAKQIYQGMQAQLPGYLLPKLVRELPGECSKMLVTI